MAHTTKESYEGVMKMRQDMLDKREIGLCRNLAHRVEDMDVGVVRLVARKAEEDLRIMLLEAKAQQRAERLHEAASVRYYIREYGRLYVEHWARDCDQYETTRLREFETHDEYFEWLFDQFESAEGPMRFTFLTPGEAAEFHPSSRDRILEAFENGKGRSVVI